MKHRDDIIILNTQIFVKRLHDGFVLDAAQSIRANPAGARHNERVEAREGESVHELQRCSPLSMEPQSMTDRGMRTPDRKGWAASWGCNAQAET